MKKLSWPRLVAASLAGIVLTLGAGVRRHCLSTTP